MRKILLLFIALITLFFVTAHAQTRSISGKVVDGDGGALPGASVLVKGSGQGAATDANGNFKITIPSTPGVILVVKFIGYQSLEVAVGDKSILSITLKEDASKLLNEVNVVNIGYGTVSKEAITGSVSSVSAKDIKDFPVATAAEALAGKLAGVTVTTTEGRPGADILIRVRGGGSLTNDNSPLYIVDGVQVDNALSLISPQEIQSIDVLKDIASTAIYGARGANGVVLITTKSGHESRTVVTASAYGGVRKIVNELPVLSPYQFVLDQYDIANYNTAQASKDRFTQTYGTFDDLDIYKNIPFVDWQNQVFGHNAQSFTQNFNLTGGTKTASYSLTLNNTKTVLCFNRALSVLLHRSGLIIPFRINSDLVLMFVTAARKLMVLVPRPQAHRVTTICVTRFVIVPLMAVRHRMQTCLTQTMPAKPT
jgi:TonB-dependent SusC/RagA subfamily outer membrane receptor